MKNNKGFTLTELMVVVAIIGILSSIALPSYRKYVRNAKMTEAKLALSEAYAAEQSIYAEYTTYASCISYFGFSDTHYYPPTPPSVYTRYYSTGVPQMSSAPAGADSGSWGDNAVRIGGETRCFGYDGTTSPPTWPSLRGGGGLYNPACDSGNSGWTSEETVRNTTIGSLTQSTFIVVSIGIISPCSVPLATAAWIAAADIWTINQNKQLLHNNVGQ